MIATSSMPLFMGCGSRLIGVVGGVRTDQLDDRVLSNALSGHIILCVEVDSLIGDLLLSLKRDIPFGTGTLRSVALHQVVIVFLRFISETPSYLFCSVIERLEVLGLFLVKILVFFFFH